MDSTAREGVFGIKTARLYLQKLKAGDAETVFLYRSNDGVSRYQSFHPKTRQDVIRFIMDNTKHIDVDHTWFQLGIHLLSGELIGDFGIHFISKHEGICEIGYTIRPEYQRRGFGREAATGVLAYLFETMEKKEVRASIDPNNEPSRKMIESMGFTLKAQKPNDLEYTVSREDFGSAIR